MPAVTDAAGNITQAETALTYGNFLQSIIDFLIIAFSIFVVIRLMMKAQEKMESLTKKEKEEEKKEEAPAEEKEEETELAILKEIRDLMKKE